MTIRLKLYRSLLRVARFAIVVLSVACSASAQTCPDGSAPTPGQKAGTTFCCTNNGNHNCCTPVQNGTGPVITLPTSGNFSTNFLGATATSPNALYEIPFGEFQFGASGAGDWNARYGAVYYNINSIPDIEHSMTTWTSTCGNATGGCSTLTPHGESFCPVELVVAGQFPDARYFAVSNYDEHFSTAQHIADLDIDPLNASTPSPFQPGEHWTSREYLVPVSLGQVPGGPSGASGMAVCRISPYEEDNLLDGTQRHPAADWNTDVTGSFPPAPPSGPSHTVDDPAHGNPNPAGSVHVRAYLSPAYGSTNGTTSCDPSNVGSTQNPLKCVLPRNSYFPDTNSDGYNSPNGYTNFVVRDAFTGCAYTADSVTSTMLVPPSSGPPPTPTAPGQFLAKSSIRAWQDTGQMTLHTTASAAIPQHCYANGDPTPPNSATLGNKVVWTRTPEHVGGQAPDDAYIAGVITKTDLADIINGASPTCQASSGCAIRFRFQVPAMPAASGTPLPCPPSQSCIQPQPGVLRYTSLTFGYQTSTCVSMTDDIDGANHPLLGPGSCSIVSLADTAFTMAENINNGSHYVTLIVNVSPYNGPLPMPHGVRFEINAYTPPPPYDTYTVSSQPVLQGAGPVQPLDVNGNQVSYYTAWMNTFGVPSTQADPYLVMDLTKFGGFWLPTNNNNVVCYGTVPHVSCAYPLVLTLRSTLLGPDPTNSSQPWACSGYSVPYSTAEYTDSVTGGGFMGPYVPLVDYPTVGALNNPGQLLPPPPPLGPGDLAPASCGVFPSGVFPSGNATNTTTNKSQWPVQYWPVSGQTAPPYLVCGDNNTRGFTPAINFVATEFTTQVTASDPLEPGNPAGPGSLCDQPDTPTSTNPCIQIIAQATQAENVTYQPPLPLTIVGTGFGYLPLPLPWVGTLPSGGTPPPYVVISNDDGSHNGLNPWSTTDSSSGLGSCQVYIANWTDTSISLLVGLPQSASNFQNTILSPFTDMGPQTFFQLTPVSKCPVSVGATATDNINVTVTNPQSGNSTSLPIQHPAPVYSLSTTCPSTPPGTACPF